MAERKKREWKDFNPNRGTSETNNPLIQKDEWLKSKIKSREGASSKPSDRSKNVAPNGKEYAGPGGGPDNRTRAAAGGNKSGSKAMTAEGTSRNFAGSGEGQGYPVRTKIKQADYSKKNSDHSDQYKAAQEKEAKKADAQVKYKKPPRRATGREAMIAERYMNQEQKKKDRQSSVVGDD